MIREYTSNDYSLLKNVVASDKFQNVYLYIDIKAYGFENKDIKTFVAYQNEELQAIIYIYHNSIQLFSTHDISDIISEEIAKFIFSQKITRVSGSISFIDAISTFIEGKCISTNGYIMCYENLGRTHSGNTFFATIEDYEEIATLIFNDPHLGSGYDYEDLLNQLKSRFLYDGCQSLCIKADDKIVSHFASYAVTDDVAVLSGMVTNPQYRKRGYGSMLVTDLSLHIEEQGLTPILYCYEEEYFEWYKKLGYKIIGTSSKLEIK